MLSLAPFGWGNSSRDACNISRGAGGLRKVASPATGIASEARAARTWRALAWSAEIESRCLPAVDCSSCHCSVWAKAPLPPRAGTIPPLDFASDTLALPRGFGRDPSIRAVHVTRTAFLREASAMEGLARGLRESATAPDTSRSMCSCTARYGSFTPSSRRYSFNRVIRSLPSDSGDCSESPAGLSTTMMSSSW